MVYEATMRKMQRARVKLQALGPLGFTTLLLGRTRDKALSFISYLQWLRFRRGAPSSVNAVRSTDTSARLTRKESDLSNAIDEYARGGFLEIGIGSHPRLERLSLLQKRGLAYVGCDFDDVCRVHREAIAAHGFGKDSIELRGNEGGSYCWTLLELLREKRLFNFVFLDGHHTLELDLSACFLIDRLLCPGGYLFVDDMRWTLEFLSENMRASFGEWNFYRNKYDLSFYSAGQRSRAHLGMIVEEILIARLNYSTVPRFSCDDWILLKKPSETSS